MKNEKWKKLKALVQMIINCCLHSTMMGKIHQRMEKRKEVFFLISKRTNKTIMDGWRSFMRKQLQFNLSFVGMKFLLGVICSDFCNCFVEIIEILEDYRVYDSVEILSHGKRINREKWKLGKCGNFKVFIYANHLENLKKIQKSLEKSVKKNQKIL